MIVTGALGKEVVPIIHDASHLDSIFVFCHNKAYHEKWTKDWLKVKGVFTKIDVMCQAIEHVAQPPVTRRPVTPELPRKISPRDETTVVDDRRRRHRDHSAVAMVVDDRRHRHRDHSAGATVVDDRQRRHRDRSVVATVPAEPTKIERESPKEARVDRAPIVDHQSDTAHLRNSSSSPQIHSKSNQRIYDKNA